jgi:hypothetical protein
MATKRAMTHILDGVGDPCQQLVMVVIWRTAEDNDREHQVGRWTGRNPSSTVGLPPPSLT